MISLSRIIKLSHYQASDESVFLELRTSPLQTEQTSERLQENHQLVKNAEEEAKIILQDAEETAQGVLREAMEQAEEIKRQALAEVERWWEEKRREAEALFQETREQASREGYDAGYADGKRQALEEETACVEQARSLLEQAYAEKERIIAEAEPFLVELSVDVAQKVIGTELHSSPEMVLEMVKKLLRRSRVHGHVAVCVNHRHYAFVQEQRAQLLALLDGQAELSIYPDHTVQDDGCVIRTPLGSIDARIDTQLHEIKQCLLDIARGSEVT
ncbi:MULTISPECIES: flagellar assembly protein FliH [Brevibacillus]|jgi:flagellar assembly protein FliH|uniref:flagellar assembly protein FliH n=1 Tax=Brevibacillus TaxID=55080 RepID=UPI001B938CE1|nr:MULTISPECIES: flagellar assembly protein FliH [Brevibacillus]MBR8659495.1 flagellar assembly protein FliH [Brevibacillus sp. NL20B1]